MFLNEISLYKKKLLLNNLVFNKKLSLDKISKNFSKKFKNINNICIIGNGPIKKNISHLIDNFDYIIRFNNYNKENDKHLLGTRTDLQIVCIPCNNEKNISSYDTWFDGNTTILPIELKYLNRYKYLPYTFHYNKFIIPNIQYMNTIKSFKSDITRGFFGIAYALQMKYKINKNIKIYIIGFGGKGHHFNSNITIKHNHKDELKIISQLKHKKILIDLNEINTLPSIQKTLQSNNENINNENINNENVNTENVNTENVNTENINNENINNDKSDTILNDDYLSTKTNKDEKIDIINKLTKNEKDKQTNNNIFKPLINKKKSHLPNKYNKYKKKSSKFDKYLNGYVYRKRYRYRNR